jgi:hypothetical protein
MPGLRWCYLILNYELGWVGLLVGGLLWACGGGEGEGEEVVGWLWLVRREGERVGR